MERLDKFLCDSGAGTRSQVKLILKSGRVTEDGAVERDNSRKIDPAKQTICLDGEVLSGKRRIVLLAGGSDSQSTASTNVANNDARIAFLKSFGWDVAASPKESSQVKIPSEPSEVFDRYNALQKSQGYDLSAFAGKTVMRYVYKINNYPGATAPVYATLLVHKDQVIGGDVTDTAPGGKIRGFKMPEPTAATAPTVPTTTTESAATEP